MNTHVSPAVAQYPALSLDAHEDGLHRISRNGTDKGSLWIRPKVRGYSVCITGGVKALMYNFCARSSGLNRA